MVAYTNTEEMKQQYDLNSLQKSSKITKRPLTTTNANGQPQPKVYKVQPIHFRELVQQLTGAQPGVPHQSQSQSQSHTRQNTTLQRVAPPPLTINPHQLQLQTRTQTRTQTQTQTSVQERQVSCKEEEQGLTSPGLEQKVVDKWEGITELTLSPNFQAWFNFAMLSPGTALPLSH